MFYDPKGGSLIEASFFPNKIRMLDNVVKVGKAPLFGMIMKLMRFKELAISFADVNMGNLFGDSSDEASESSDEATEEFALDVLSAPNYPPVRLSYENSELEKEADRLLKRVRLVDIKP